MVGQRFIALLEAHPWFEVRVVAASSRSAGKKYSDVVTGRWAQERPVPALVADLIIQDCEADKERIAEQVDFVFSAIEADKAVLQKLEEDYAALGVPVVSNNSAHRWTADVPIILPEINPHHTDLIDIQRKNRGWERGLIAVKPNCSIQSYVPVLHALKDFGVKRVMVCTYQAISGAGKTFETFPEILDNIIPLIGGEEEKTEREPLKVWGTVDSSGLQLAQEPAITSHCIRVPVSDGHLAAVHVELEQKPSQDEVLHAIKHYKNPVAELSLPSSPPEFLVYHEEENRPQTKLDRMIGNGMSVSVGRLRPDNIFDWRFVGLSHNTIRGAAGGAILLAELLAAKEYITGRE